jgi:hypothetical protein
MKTTFTFDVFAGRLKTADLYALRFSAPNKLMRTGK